ncbi:MAG: DUF5696 domain-containing protein, partial [Ardenticatenaceae bacterium]
MPSIRRLIPRFMLIGLLVTLVGSLWVRWLDVTAAGSEHPLVPGPHPEGPGAPPAAVAAAQGPGAEGIPDAFTQVGENDTYQLYADPATLAFKVVDKRSGYVWHSNLDEVVEEDELNRTWTAFATSGISIDYLDQEADDERASITSAEHVIDFNPTGAPGAQGFEASLTFVEPSITLAVRVQLEADGVRVEVPFESIREEDPEFRLGFLHLYPFFGATREDSVSGYMFIPDGAGTLIRLAAETKARNMFLGRYYGADLGIISTLPYNPDINRPYQISIPVIGMVHGEKENAFLAV